MPNLDLSFTITAIIALISLVSPILTAIINNWHDSKIRKLESQNRIYEQTVIYKRDILINYLSCIGKCISYCQEQELKEYGFYYARSLALITNEQTIKLMQDLHNELTNECIDNTNTLFNNLVPLIQKEIINSHQNTNT